jgi:PKHD-type hydroxylase
MSYLPYFWIRHRAISKEQCDLVLAERKTMQTKDAGVGINNEVDPSAMRKTNIAWAPANHWLEGVMFNNAMYANRECNWNFEATLTEQVQLAQYSKGNYYGWHIDTFFLSNTPVDRKLSIIILLNDPSEFEGGQLQIENSGVDHVPLEKGSIVVFPSYLPHQATEVTKGTRYSGALWVSGKTFK